MSSQNNFKGVQQERCIDVDLILITIKGHSLTWSVRLAPLVQYQKVSGREDGRIGATLPVPLGARISKLLAAWRYKVMTTISKNANCRHWFQRSSTPKAAQFKTSGLTTDAVTNRRASHTERKWIPPVIYRLKLKAPFVLRSKMVGRKCRQYSKSRQSQQSKWFLAWRLLTGNTK